MHIHIHIHIRACMHACVRAYTHTRERACAQAQTQRKHPGWGMSLHTMLGSPCPGEGIWSTTPSLLRFKILKAKRGEFPASYFLQHFGVQRRGAPFQHPIFCEGTLSSKRQGVSSTLFSTIRLCPAPRGPFPAPCLLGGSAFQQKVHGLHRQFIYSTLAPSETAGCCFFNTWYGDLAR